ncbi:Hydrolase [Escovopsis weberi]|uniref:Hydrolase n=1 Tax=Escovopsis weberi TaxID=150374 RepID=A0A0M8N189_ESCWE|nr:Hydrolase [Escovopsis weberi]
MLIRPRLIPSSSVLKAHPIALQPLPHPRLLPLASARATMSSTGSSSASPLQQPVRLACIQLSPGPDKAANLRHAASQIAAAARAGSKIVVLPECFNSPYGTSFFAEYAETLPAENQTPSSSASPSVAALAAAAREHAVYLVGGSIPERNPSTGQLHNTSLVFGPDGALLARHRKVHLFDIDIPGRISFRESDVLSPGNKLTLVDLPGYGRIAVAICYDVRFPELAAVAARRGAFALVYPGAFNCTTGPMHWRLLAQARAVDNQLYVAMCSPARDPQSSYQAWGHSIVVDPMANVLAEADERETIVYADLKAEDIDNARRSIPLDNQRRFDVYPDVSKGKVSYEDPNQ